MFGSSAKHWVICVITAMSLVAGLVAGDETPRRFAFTPGNQGEYTFDTGVLRGTLRQNGASRGLSSVVHIPSGARLDGSVGIAGHYRVFTTNKRYGTAAWDWPSTAELQSDGSVRTTWPAVQDRPFEMTALYRWADAQTLDVETTVTARTDLSKFESFFASYFDKAFPSPYACVTGPAGSGESTFLPGTKDLGDWLMFIRQADERTRVIQDGRWLLEPNPVKWAVRPNLAAPLCLRRSQTNGLTAIVMAPLQDCFAVAMPCEGDSHYSLYLSLFGRDIKACETATAHVRLVITKAVSDEEIVALYKHYVSETQSSGRPGM
jgi:hypothetical protein